MSERCLPGWLAPRELGLCLALLAGWSCAIGSWAANPPPPLVADDDAPLLLNDATNAAPTNLGASGVDINAACYVCHANFRDDPFVQSHARTNIGCIKCHGESKEHVADEANLTPPNAMYWPSRIRISCYGCHPVHQAPAHEVLARWAERCPQKTNAVFVVCTDCHGAHRMPVRAIVWDKRTGQLLSKGKPNIYRAAAGPPPGPVEKPVAAAPPISAAALAPPSNPKTP